jgi:hypothetical protein
MRRSLSPGPVTQGVLLGLAARWRLPPLHCHPLRSAGRRTLGDAERAALERRVRWSLRGRTVARWAAPIAGALIGVGIPVLVLASEPEWGLVGAALAAGIGALLVASIVGTVLELLVGGVGSRLFFGAVVAATVGGVVADRDGLAGFGITVLLFGGAIALVLRAMSTRGLGPRLAVALDDVTTGEVLLYRRPAGRRRRRRGDLAARRASATVRCHSAARGGTGYHTSAAAT